MKYRKFLTLLILIIFAISGLSYADKKTKSEKKSKMPPASESSGDAREVVAHKNALQEKEKEQSDEESKKDAEEKDESKNKDEEKKERDEDKQILRIQGFEEDAQQIQDWLEDLLGRPLNLSDPQDKAIYDFWTGLLDKGYTFEQIGNLIDTVGLAKKTIDFWYQGYFFQMGKVDLNDVEDHKALFNWASLILEEFSPQDVRLLIIVTRVYRDEIKDNMLHRDLNVTKLKDVKIIAGWSIYRRQGYSASGIYNLFKNKLLPEIKKLLPDFDMNEPAYAGFFTFWCEDALARLYGGLDYDANLLDAMAQIRPEVEALIGKVDFLDGEYKDNGFLTYWAEQAMEKGVDYIKQHLYIWKQLLPYVEQAEGRELDLFNPDDGGLLDYWANKVEELMAEEGLDLETAIQRVIELILQEEPTVYDELIPYIEQLLGVTFDENNPQHMGFLTYWSQRAEEEGLENIENLLQAMIDVKDEVEALIGQINFLDDNPQDDGFITYWAERALQEGTQNIERILSNMAEILPEVENLIGNVNLLDDNPSDDGFLTYWAEYANDVGIDNVKQLLSYMNQLKPHLENLVGEINLLDEQYDDNGLLTFWAQYGQENGIQKAINIIDNMVQIKDEVEALIGPVDLYDHQYGDNGFLTYWAEYALDVGIDRVEQLLTAMAEIKSEVEALIGKVDFFDDNYDDNGFITYWAEYAVENGVSKTKDILSNMKAILENDWDGNGTPEIVELIGEINFFDSNYDDNGFLTYWAERALSGGVGEINKTLYIWKRLLPYVEEHEGRELNLFDPDDSGIISYWEGEVRRLMQEENLSLEEAIQKVIDILTGGTSTASFLYQTSEKVLNFFKDNIGIDPETGLPYSFITTTEDGIIRHNFFTPEFTALSDIAMQIVSLISLQKIGKMSQEELEAKIEQILNSIKTLPTYSPQEGEFKDNIYFFNYYTLPDKEVAFGNFISAVDNANMVMALILAREACPQHAQEINDLISKINLKFFYDSSVHLFRGGYYYDSNSGAITPADFHYGMLNTETRLISYLAIGKGDLSSQEAEQHWQALSRPIKQAYGIDVLASYGGSLFETLFPTLFLDEANLSQNGFGLDFKKAILIQKLQAIENGMPFWGESPAFDEIYEYSEFGSQMGVNPYQSRGIISPYSVFLALNAVSKDGNYLQLLEELYPETVQSETGLVDAIDINNDLPVYLKSALVQGIVLASIANYLNGGIKNLFMQTQEAQRIIPFIQAENYFSQQQIDEELQAVHDMIQNAISQNQWQKAKALFDYFKDLVIGYNKQADFPDLNDLNSAVQNLVAQNITQLYQNAQEEINNQNFNQAIKDLLTVLYYQPDNQDAFNLLNLARQLRKEQIEIPDVTYLITNFEQGCRPNQYVSKIGPVNGPNGNIEVGILEGDPSHGKILKLKYELQPGGFNGIYINIDNLELAKSGKLVFDLKGDDSIGIPEKVKIELHFEGSEWPYPAIEITGISSDWQHIEIDLSQLLPALPDNFKLEQIAIIFEGDKVGNSQGAIYIDNIGFRE